MGMTSLCHMTHLSLSSSSIVKLLIKLILQVNPDLPSINLQILTNSLKLNHGVNF